MPGGSDEKLLVGVAPGTFRKAGSPPLLGRRLASRRGLFDEVRQELWRAAERRETREAYGTQCSVKGKFRIIISHAHNP